MNVAAEIAAALGGRLNGSGWIAPCPCHADNNPSLSISEGSDGKALLHCHAGCRQEALVQWARDNGLDLSGKRRERKPARRIVAEYDYRDETGALRYQVVRWQPKDFRQCRPDGKGGWTWNVDGVEPLPYRLPELLAALGKTVFVTEGEKDVDQLIKEGMVGTCNSGGAGKFQDEIVRWFEDRDIVIVPDNDETGRNHAEDVARKLRGIARRIRVLELSGLPEKGDVSNWLDAGHTVKDLRRLAHAAPVWEPREGEPEQDHDHDHDPDADARPPKYSDDALALRFSAQHGDDARFAALWGKWLLWNGACWQFDLTMRAFDLARAICRVASAEIVDPKRARLAAAIASAKSVAAVISLARADRRHATETEQFDSDPWVLNTSGERR